MLVIPVFVPHAGCPHACCFCNQKIISGQRAVPAMKDVVDSIELFRDAAQRYQEVQIAFYGGSFTAIEKEQQRLYLETAQPYLKKNGGFVDSLRLSTRPDCIDDKTLRRLKEYNVSVVELGAQSMDDVVLTASGRGHLSEHTVTATEMLRKNGFKVGIQTMTGLPSANEKSDLRTAKMVCDLLPDFVRVYPTVVVRDTALYYSYLLGNYHPYDIDAAVSLCAKISEIYEAAGIPIIRMGLQSSDNISRDGDVVAGPYHEAFGQLVRSKRLLDKMTHMLDVNMISNAVSDIKKEADTTLAIYIDEKSVSDCVGQCRVNVRRLKEQYGFKNVKVIAKKERETYTAGVYKSLSRKLIELVL